jgi:hypothetical protein
MQKNLWGEKIPLRRCKKHVIPHTSEAPYTITDNDCQIFGHTLRSWDLAGCTTCIDCNTKIFCPGCIAHHPQDDQAVPVLCERHEESQVSA